MAHFGPLNHAFAISKTFWPVNKKAEELEDPYPDIYMRHYHASIRFCTLESGEYVAGGSKVLMAAFMVS
jgi:hypothetical protein